MSENYTSKVIEALKISHPDTADRPVTATTHFHEIPGMDSMSVVSFQMELAALIGPKAEQATPIMDMTVAEFAEVLASL